VARSYNPEKYRLDKQEALTKAYPELVKVEQLALQYAPINVNWYNPHFVLQPATGQFLDIHQYFYQVISAFPNKASDAAGVRLLYNLWETNSQKIVGVLRISSDFLRLGPRDKYLGLTKGFEDRKQVTLQLKGVIPLPPFNQMAGGKLLTALAFSNNVQQEIRTKGQFCGLSVCSIYGESIIYDRIPYLKFLGETVKGTGVYFGPTATNYREFIEGKEDVLKMIDRPDSEIIKWWQPLYERRLAKVPHDASIEEFKITSKVKPMAQNLF